MSKTHFSFKKSSSKFCLVNKKCINLRQTKQRKCVSLNNVKSYEAQNEAYVVFPVVGRCTAA